jgi:hypothetical protein
VTDHAYYMERQLREALADLRRVEARRAAGFDEDVEPARERVRNLETRLAELRARRETP